MASIRIFEVCENIEVHHSDKGVVIELGPAVAIGLTVAEARELADLPSSHADDAEKIFN